MSPRNRSMPGSGANERLPRERRIRKRADFLRIQGGGRRVHMPHFVVMLQPSEHARLGITVTRRVAGAVGRNRIKRVVREAYRRRPELFPQDCEIVVVARRGAQEVGLAQFLAELQQATRALHRSTGNTP